MHLSFELDNNEKSPGDFTVKLVQHGQSYHVVRTDGKPLETKRRDAADMKGKTKSKRFVLVSYVEKP